MAKSKADPVLLLQLEAAEAGHSTLRVVCQLRPAATRKPRGPEQTDTLARGVLDRVREQTGQSPTRVNVFRNMDSFAVEATAEFIRGLLVQDAVTRVLPSNRSEDMPTRPVSRTAVDEPTPD